MEKKMTAILLTKPAPMPRPMWFTHRIFRVIASITLVVFGTSVCTPLIAAVQMHNGQQSLAASLSIDQQLEKLIDEVRVSVGPNATEASKRAFNPVRALERFDQLSGQVRQSIEAEHKTAVQKNAGEKTIQMLNEQLQLFNERAQTFRTYLVNLSPSTSLSQTLGFEKSAIDEAQGHALSVWLDKVSPLPEPEDLSEMSFQTLKPNSENVPKDFAILETQYKAFNLVAATKNASFTDSQYKGSKGEAEITTDVRAKATALSNNALNIYNWVRNNVEWQPTWGGQQTADMTLDVKKGNAMDIATLTIALMRAANIPARYAYGSVEVPVEQFINMAGDFENIDAAMDFVSAGGVPVVAIMSGGQVKQVRIEHVWVEVALPYYPSQGTKAVSTRNPIDTWVPIDPSSKTYTYLTGLDTAAIVNLDGEQISNNFIDSGTVNETEGWVQGLNSNIIQQAQEDAQKKLEAHINTMTDPTVGDVIGGRTIDQQTFDFFPSSLPYPKVTRGASYSELPDSLRTRVTLGLGWSIYDFDYQYKKTIPLYLLNQRNITISFKPATAADETALKALVPENLTDPSQLPSFISSSIKVIPEIKRDSEVLLTGNTLAVGEEVDMGYSFHLPTQNYNLNKRDAIVAGSYLALGIVGSNTSQKTFSSLKTNLENTKKTLETGTEAQIKNLTRERVVGDVYVAGIQGYYAQYITQSKIMSLRAKTSHLPLPMAGTFGYEPNPRTSFGIVRGIEAHGLYMNIRTAQAVQDSKGDQTKNKLLMQQVGMLSSALEHQIPEQMYTDPNSATKPEGFSTAKALTMAMAQGQKIYTINQQNQTQALQNLRLDSGAMDEIRSSLASGKEIIAHTDQLTIAGYKGSGYVILDATTGEGVYKISGGKNGSFLEDLDDLLLNFYQYTLDELITNILDLLKKGLGTAYTAISTLVDAWNAMKECSSTAHLALVVVISVAYALAVSFLLVSIGSLAGPAGAFIGGIIAAILINLVLTFLWEEAASGPFCRE